MELELADEDTPVLYVPMAFRVNIYLNRTSRYRIGEAYAHLPHARALKKLEKDQATLENELSKLKDQAEDCEKEMKGLKVILYAKFGKAINLDE